MSLIHPTSAALVIVLQAPLDCPVQLRVRRGEAKNFLNALRMKLTRERQRARSQGAVFTDFLLTMIDVQQEADSAADILTVVRTMSREVKSLESARLQMALKQATLSDKLTLLQELENATNVQLPETLRRTDRWRWQQTTAFDCIAYKAEYDATRVETADETAGITSQIAGQIASAYSQYEDDANDDESDCEATDETGAADSVGEFGATIGGKVIESEQPTGRQETTAIAGRTFSRFRKSN